MTTPPPPKLGRAATVAFVLLGATGLVLWSMGRSERPAPAVLRVDVTGEDLPMRYEFRWATAAAPTWLYARLATEARAATAASPPNAAFPVPAGHWTLLRGSLRGAAAPVAFRLVPPFQGDRTERIELTGRRAIHAVLLDTDWRTPAAGREVRLYASDLRRMQLPEQRAVRATDEHGMVTFDDLEDSGFILCAPGAQPGDASPHAVRIDFSRGTEANEQPCTLVAPAARQRVALEVQAELERKPGVSPKLFFARKDDGSGALFEQPAILQPGAQDVELELPAGRYRVFVWPIGELLVDPRDELLDVAAAAGAARHLVRVRPNPDATEVELLGLGQQDLPVRVYPQPAGELLDDRPDKMSWGPYRWHVATMSVPTVAGPRRLLAFGPARSFVSARPVELEPGAKITVEMMPATELTIRWFDWDPDRDRGATVFVEVSGAGDDGFLRTLWPALEAGALRPALTGTLSLPRGALHIECQRADGTLLWQRDLDPDPSAAAVEVAVGFDRP